MAVGYRRAKHNPSVYRSGLEELNAKTLDALKVPYVFEGFRIPFIQPAKDRTYTPDFLIIGNGIIVETKGEFISDDRQKHLLIKEQYPLLDIRFVFSAPGKKIYKGSKTTCAVWATKHGFLWHAKLIPEAWLKESPNIESLKIIKELYK